jgi:hypothetical protein
MLVPISLFRHVARAGLVAVPAAVSVVALLGETTSFCLGAVVAAPTVATATDSDAKLSALSQGTWPPQSSRSPQSAST